MRTVKLNIKDNIYQNVMFVLESFKEKGVQIEEITKLNKNQKDKETLKLRRRYTLMAIEMWEGSPDTHERKEYNIDYFKKELEIIDKELEKLQSKTI